MSLVVARRIEDEIRIVSDTKMSRTHALHQTPVQGGLKCILVSPICSISFAGNVGVAELALTPLIQSATSSRREITSRLLAQHQANACEADFIVAFVGETICIDRISAGVLEEDLPSTWIGEAAAFEAYQTNYHAALAQQATRSILQERFRIAGAMHDALRAVVADPSIDSVGDFTVSVTSRPVDDDGFRYLSHTFGSGFAPIANTTEETSITRSLGVEGGSYHYCVLVPTIAGVGALAVHIREARMGVLFCPAVSWASIPIRGVDTDSFICEIQHRFGIIVDGLRT